MFLAMVEQVYFFARSLILQDLMRSREVAISTRIVPNLSSTTSSLSMFPHSMVLIVGVRPRALKLASAQLKHVLVIRTMVLIVGS